MTYKEHIDRLARFPEELQNTVKDLNDEQLDTPYGEGKWTIRQVVHHFADSHMGGYRRTKRTYTEDNPTLSIYDQDGWANTADANSGPIEPSMSILKGLHIRWTRMLSALDDTAWSKPAIHPNWGPTTLGAILELYSNHCDNHLNHINNLKASKNW